MTEVDAFPSLLSLKVAAVAMLVVAPAGIGLAPGQGRSAMRQKLAQ